MIRHILAISSLVLVTPLVVLAEDQPATKPKPAAKSVTLKDVKLTVPTTWKPSTPEGKFRVGQFAIPAVKGDKEPGELIVYFFGEFGGGGVEENIRRWEGQFDSKGRKSKVTLGKSSQGAYVVVDVSGTYNKPIGPPVLQKTSPMPGARMLAVILAVEKKGQYFLKLTGPAKTVTAASADFRRSFGGDATSEKELKPEAKQD